MCYTCTKLVRGQGDVRRKRPNVTSAPHCSTFSWNFKRIGISICKPRNYLDYVTWKGKGPQDLDVSAAIASQSG